MAKQVFEVDSVCTACKGTGIYVGFAEHDGAGVVCHDCKGTGCYHIKISYEPFQQRKGRKDIQQVYRTNPGIGIGLGKDREGRDLALSDFGGIDYTAWFSGADFHKGSEMRRYVCPAWWFQCVDYSKKPEWKECIGCGSFSDCSSFPAKDKCWERYDREHG